MQAITAMHPSLAQCQPPHPPCTTNHTHPQVQVLLGPVTTALHIHRTVAIVCILGHIPLAPCRNVGGQGRRRAA